tara:strand:+ start:585 stop:794 length:210 start_codon:yes stop_codon:yes gene_type:complete
MEKKHMGLFDKILLNIIKGRAKNTLKLIQDDPVLKKNAKEFTKAMIDFKKATKKREKALSDLEKRKLGL